MGDLMRWFSNHEIQVYEKDRIYFVIIQHQKYFIKRLYSRLEYEISKELEILSLPTFFKSKLFVSQSLEHDKNKKYDYMVTEEIKGECLLQMLNRLTVKELDDILQTIFFSLEQAWDILGFVHLDLHFGNILIQKINEPIILERRLNSSKISFFKKSIIVEKYMPVIFDFDISITSSTKKNHSKTIWNDVWKVLGTLSLYAKDKKGQLILDYIEEFFIDRYEFQERKEEFANQWFNVPPTSLKVMN
jgi:hypothetical protein